MAQPRMSVQLYMMQVTKAASKTKPKRHFGPYLETPWRYRHL